MQGCPPFAEGIDLFGFFKNIDEAEAQRYADVEITHGRVAMLAALGFLVGEQVEGSSFLFDAQVTVGVGGGSGIGETVERERTALLFVFHFIDLFAEFPLYTFWGLYL